MRQTRLYCNIIQQILALPDLGGSVFFTKCVAPCWLPTKWGACWPASLQCVLDESGSLSSTQAFAIINPRTSLRNPRLRNWAAQIPIYKFLSEGAHCQTGSVGHARSIAPRFYRQEIKSSSPNLTAQEWSRWTDLSVIPVDFCMNSNAFLWFHLISSDICTSMDPCKQCQSIN